VTVEARAFRTGRTLAEHGEQLTSIREQQRTAFGNTDSLGDAIGAPGDRTIAERLESMERQPATIERVLFAIAREQDITPESTD
jgi:hypothetical protein